jgi:hypothetical protein
VSYFEWSGETFQKQIVPWTRIGSLDEAHGWVAAMEMHPPRAVGWTSISGAIDYARLIFAEAPWTGTRRVLDISGDGVNNSGRDPAAARDAAVAEGITINGLPILQDRPMPGVSSLDEYYKENVVGGPGAFVLPASDFRSFAQALRRKLILEIAGAMPDRAAARA